MSNFFDVARDAILGLCTASNTVANRKRTVFVFCFFTRFSVSSRVPLLPKVRSRVRAGSAQRQAARPVWVGQV